MKADMYDKTGKKAGSMDLPESLFGAKINTDLMHRAVVLRLANRRNPIAHTKTRGEVVCSTRKAFRQKGTGNARRGAKSTNLLRGGGVTHGPRNTVNYTKMMPKKERRAALFSALSAKAAAGQVYGLAELGMETPSTKSFVGVLGKLPEAKNYLFVLPTNDVVTKKSMANVPNVDTIMASYLNPLDVLKAEAVFFVGDSVKVAEETFTTVKS